jgi:hypothetical protein
MNKPRPSPEQLGDIEFGYTDSRFLILALLGSALIYGFGWTQEDSTNLLGPGAVILWGVVLPLWLAAFAFAWKSFWGQWLPGFAVGLPIFLIHVLVIFLLKGYLDRRAWDISAAFAGVALLGWVLGRILHLAVHRMRAKTRS